MSSSGQDGTAAVSESGVKPYITFIILFTGVIGGLVIVVSVILICKYCVKRKRVLRRRHVVERERPQDKRLKPLLRYDSLESGAAEQTSVSLDFNMGTPQGILLDDYEDGENEEDKEALLDYYMTPPHSARVQLPEESIEGGSRDDSSGIRSPPGAVGGAPNNRRRVSFKLDHERAPPSAGTAQSVRRYTESEFDYKRRGQAYRGQRVPRQHSLGARIPESVPLSSARSPRASDPEFSVELRRRLEQEQQRIQMEEEFRSEDRRKLSDDSRGKEALAETDRKLDVVAEGAASPITLHMLDDSPSPTSKPRTTQVSVEVHQHPRPMVGAGSCDGSDLQYFCGDGTEGSLDDRTSQRSDPTSSRPLCPPRELRIRSVDMRVHSHSMEIVSPEKHAYNRKTRRIKSYDDVADYDILRITEFTKGPFYNVDYDAMSDGSVGSLSINKVRYNDTGSMEHLDEDNLKYMNEFDGATGGPVEESDDTETLNGTRKYRELWELRATLEDECCDTTNVQGSSSFDVTPDKENVASGTTSFESNTDPAPYPQDCEMGHCKRRPSQQQGDQQSGCGNLLHPNYENRRQSYKNIISKRLQKLDAPGATTSAENSFDSVETMDTDGEVSDTSRYEVTTTSFESTTDNTTDSNTENQNNKLKSMRGDSGYKSLETQSTLKGTERKRGSVSLDYADTIDHDLFSFDITKLKDGSPTHSPFDFERLRHRRRSSQTCHFERRGAKTASKKRREYSRERQAVQVYESIMEPEDSKSDQPSGSSFEEASVPGKVSVFSRFFRSQSKAHRPPRYAQRDYSIDQKTNELFNEFMRIDPIYETRRSPRLQPRPKLQRKNTEPTYLESRRPDRLAPEMRSTSLGSDSSASSLRRLSPQDSIEEEEYDYEEVANVVWPGSSRPSPLTSQPTIHEIPIIQLPEEESADC